MKRRHFLALISAAVSTAWLGIVKAYAHVVKNKPEKVVHHTPQPLQTTSPLVLFVLGDWGAGGSIQRNVAASMNNLAGTTGYNPAAIISTGDNIYPDGVDSATDPRWKVVYENVYTGANIQVPWWAVLGNHDYRKNPDAQIEYHRKNPQWNMPARFWATTIAGKADNTVVVIGLDTQALHTKMPGWKEQIEWLQEELERVKNVPWKIVVGHHPMRSYGHYSDTPMLLQHVKPLLEKYGVQMYLCGHDHDQQIIQYPNDTFLCLLSGAGAGSRDTTWGTNTLYASTNGGFSTLRFGANVCEVTVYSAKGEREYQHSISRV